MNLEFGDRLRQMGLVIGITHGTIYMFMAWNFMKASTERDSFTSGYTNNSSRLKGAYVIMATLSLAEAMSGFVLVAAIAMTKAVCMLPWLVVTSITVITGMVYAVSIFPYGRMVMMISLLILSTLALFPVFSLYRKYKNVSTAAPAYSRADNYPLNMQEVMATAPPPDTYAPATNNRASKPLDGEPPSYDAAMGIAAAPPYPPANTSGAFAANPPYPILDTPAAPCLGIAAAPPYPPANTSGAFASNPPYPIVDPPAAPSLGWRSDLTSGYKK